jgi:hypothetical protein
MLLAVLLAAVAALLWGISIIVAPISWNRMTKIP